MNSECKFLIEIVKEASTLLNNHFEVFKKGEDGDLVTNLDFMIEKFLTQKIKEKYPDFDIVGEEFNSKARTNQNWFTIDPIDGTINFAHGFPLWAIQVACVKNGKTVAGVIYAPEFDELYYADETGAYLNGEKLSLKPLPVNQSLTMVLGKNFYPKMLADGREQFIKTRDIFCGALSYAYFVSGKMQALAIDIDLAPWDKTPGDFMCEQIGAFKFKKGDLTIYSSSQEYLDEILRQIGEKK